MKIACTSDTHGRRFTIPKCDVFIHAGDFTAGGSREEMKEFLYPIVEAIRSNTIRECILVPGNHDRCCEHEESIIRQMIHAATYDGDGWESPAPDRIHLLLNDGIEIEGKTFWGSPYTPPFMDWHFMASEEELAEMYKAIPNNLDVLITHGPPFGILDPGWKAANAGSIALLDAFHLRLIKNHVFGHLHGGGGKKSYQCGTKFYNVAACNEAYQLVNQPMVLEI